MKRSLFLAVVCICAAVAAQAEPPKLRPQIMKCLGAATNYEILTEVNARMSLNIPTEPVSENTISIVCDYSSLKINTTDMQTGKLTSQTIALSNSTQCNELAANIKKAKDSNLTQNKIVGVCDYSVLKRVLIKTNLEISELEAVSYSNSSQCATALSQL